ncbi:uncharacterized protein LOC131952775 [Physella acuta]|uniref:uncharacterized protein LOC131952775 n=1 Tax=Physella acuta TaxID=109671 RepID=UPI0027DBEC10|nr:uncharacterized protein LOC131952775 [Physella acuta]
MKQAMEMLLCKLAKVNWTQVSVIVGTILIAFPISFSWFYGNLSSYIDSYYINKLGEDGHSVGSMWMMAIFSFGMNMAVVFSGMLSKKIGPWLTAAVAMVAYNFALFMSFFTIQHSFWLLHVTLGALGGISTGACYSMVLYFPVLWAPEKVALVSSIVLAAPIGGSIIINQVITLYINPENDEPNLSLGQSHYFNQDDIIERVPYVFLVIGGLSSSFHVISLLLLRNPVSPNTTTTKLKEANLDEKTTCEVNLNNYSSISQDQSKPDQQGSDLLQVKQETHIFPWKTLKSVNFYLITFSATLMIGAFIAESNYYKQFGLLYITDDHFLTNLGVAVSVVSTVCRICVFSYVLEKFSYNTVSIFVTASQAIVVVFWYFTPRIDKWLYLFTYIFIQAIQSGSMILFPLITLRVFGPEDYVVNYGLVLLMGSVILLLTPFLMQLILLNFGWFWVFFSISLTSVAALVMFMYLPQDTAHRK